MRRATPVTAVTVMAEPRPAEQQAAEELTGERFVPGGARGEWVEAEHLGRYLWAAAAAKDRIVLDAGCGLGYGTAILARAGAHTVTGMDIDRDAVRSAGDRFGDVAEFGVADLMELPPHIGHFSLVVCFEAIEHVADPGRALDEIARVMRDDGVLIVSSPNRGVYPEGNPFHLEEYSAEELERELRSRFENVRMYRQLPHLATLIVDDDALTSDDPEREIPGGIRKLVPAEPGEELYSIGVAGDRELPALDAMAMLTGPLSVRLWFDHIEAVTQRARRAEAEAISYRAQRDQYRRQRDSAVQEAEALRGSRRLRARD
jgi:SAM-dependent methyltransferase